LTYEKPAIITIDKTKPGSNTNALIGDSLSGTYALGSGSAAVEWDPWSQQRTMATLVSPKISGHSVASAKAANSSISEAKRFLNDGG